MTTEQFLEEWGTHGPGLIIRALSSRLRETGTDLPLCDEAERMAIELTELLKRVKG